MSVDRCRAETTSTQFLKWIAFLNDEDRSTQRQDWLFAQLSYHLYVLRKAWTGGKVEFEPKDFLIKFGGEGKHPVHKPADECSQEELDANWKEAMGLKQSIMGALGVGQPAAPAAAPKPKKEPKVLVPKRPEPTNKLIRQGPNGP